MKLRANKAFSLIELAIVMVVIGVFVAGIYQASSLFYKSKLQSARALSNASDVNSIKNLLFWFDSTREGVFINSNGSTNVQDNDLITTWNSYNVQDNTAISASINSAIYYPKYVERGINDLPSLKFDGVNNYLIVSASTGNLRNVSFTLFVVGKSNLKTSGTNRYFFGGLTQRIYLVQPPSGIIRGVFGPGTALLLDYSPTPDATFPFIAEISYNASTSLCSLYVNNIFASSGTKAYTGASSPIYLGAFAPSAQVLDGLVGEYIYFDRDLTSEESGQITQYLAKKWKIQI